MIGLELVRKRNIKEFLFVFIYWEFWRKKEVILVSYGKLFRLRVVLFFRVLFFRLYIERFLNEI